MLNINSLTIFFVCSTWGGWEPNPLKIKIKISSSSHFCVTQLRGYAVTRMLLYNQLYPKKVSLKKRQSYSIQNVTTKYLMLR